MLLKISVVPLKTSLNPFRILFSVLHNMPLNSLSYCLPSSHGRWLDEYQDDGRTERELFAEHEVSLWRRDWVCGLLMGSTRVCCAFMVPSKGYWSAGDSIFALLSYWSKQLGRSVYSVPILAWEPQQLEEEPTNNWPRLVYDRWSRDTHCFFLWVK